MPLILLDGCEDTSSFIGPLPTIAGGRNGRCFSITGGITNSFLVPTAQRHATITFGFAFRYTGTPSGAGPIMNLLGDDGSVLFWNANGSLYFQGAYSAHATTAVGLVPYNTWAYIEVKATHGDAPNGSVTLRVNGAQVGQALSIDTKVQSGVTSWSGLGLAFPYNGAATCDFDDFYVMTGPSDSFLGPIAVETLYPNGNGNANQWIGSDGNSTDNYLLVDEVSNPNVSDFVYSTTVGHQDMYTMTDHARSTGTVIGVCHSAHMLSTDQVAPPNVKLVNRRATDTKSAAIAMTSAYRSYDYCLVTDPETGAAFTRADVNALQSGVELA